MKEPTPRQAAILDWVRRYIDANQIAPSLGEIADAFGIKTRHGVSVQLKALERKGKLTRRKGSHRTIRLL